MDARRKCSKGMRKQNMGGSTNQGHWKQHMGGRGMAGGAA